MNRRGFLQSAISAAAAAGTALGQDAAPDWGGPVIDVHLHLRQGLDANMEHMRGCGVTHAVLLTPANADERAQAIMQKYAGRFARFDSIPAGQPGGIELLRKVAQAGAIGFGEMKSRVAVDGPEMRQVFDLAQELGFPVTIHFQEVPQSPTDQNYQFNTGLVRLPQLLKQYPKVIFVGHADFFWANISADVPKDNGYPTTKVKPGGLTDKLLSDYPNMYGDMSANSGRNSIARDPEFAKGFLTRHQDKLMFGSDCTCRDGRGTGQNSTQPLIKGKCVARETLGAIKSLVAPEVFRKIAFGNASKLLKIRA